MPRILRIPPEELPQRVLPADSTWIPMRDGTRLAARIWMPEGAETAPVPAILEYIPYRQHDSTRPRDETNFRYFAAHGYAGVRVDLRGSGNSEGVIKDEYLQTELDDGCDILKWIAEQPWCDGKVGMIGISWGGFNGLQIAAMQPPELQAVIAVCATDDRYADDVHYMGGCLLGDNLSWASTMFAYISTPPDPEIMGESWRDHWLARLEGTGLWLHNWLKHQRRDEFWKHGSICEDYSQVTCPVMAVSGWADGYSDAVFRMMEKLPGPRQGLIGPWSHLYPHLGVPGPAIGFLQEALRWYDYWLKGIPTGIMDEPMLRTWVQEYTVPSTSYVQRPGRWVGEDQWPSPNIEWQDYTLGTGGLMREGTMRERPLTLQSPLTLGQFAGKWCSYSHGPDMPADQREEDGGALVFDSPVLENRMEILGRPVLDVVVSSSKPVAMIAARLSDVAPDGKVTRVTYGVFNLCHREGHEHPQPIEPGEKMRIRLELNAIGHAYPPGHQIRVALSSSYWPLVWVPPEPVQLTVYSGVSQIFLPVRPMGNDERPIEFAQPEGAVIGEIKEVIEPPEHRWVLTRDLATDESLLQVSNTAGVWNVVPIDLVCISKATERYAIREGDIYSARGETVWERGLRRGAWRAHTITKTTLTCTAEEFIIDADLDAYEGDRRVYAHTWHERVPRDHV